MHRLLTLCCLALLAACDALPPRLDLADARLAAGEDASDATRPGLDARIERDGEPLDRGALDGEPLVDMTADWGELDFAIVDDMPDLTPLDFDVPDLDVLDFDVFDIGLPDFGLPDLDPPDLDPPDLDPPDVFVPPVPELCNGIDDDLNGIIDDAPVCGGVIAGRCRVFLGIANGAAPGAEPLVSWGACPAADTDDYGAGDGLACVGTRFDRTFRRIGLPAFDTLDDGNHIALAFRCDHPLAGPVEAWIASRCRVYLGQADRNADGDVAVHPSWGPCPERSGRDGDLQCVSSGGDQRFHVLPILGTANNDDAFAVAFRCDDAADPARAEAMQASASVVLGWAERSFEGSVDRSPGWGDACPGPANAALDDSGGTRCASSAFDGLFHRFNVVGIVSASVDAFGFGGFDAFGIALLPHPAAP